MCIRDRTINAGLRYQIQGGWHELHNKLGDFDPTITNPLTNTLGAMWFSPNNGRNSVEAQVNNIILPRIGFAWSLKNNLSLIHISPWLKFFGRADYNISDSNRVTMSVTEQNNPAPSLSPLCPVD